MPPESLDEIVARERPRSRGERVGRILLLLTPFVASVVALAVVGIAAGFGAVRALVANAILSFVVLGKFLILKGIAGGRFDAFELAILVFWMDLAVSFLFTFNLDYAYRFPYLGRRLAALSDHGREMLEERPWLRKITFLGIVLFVMFPLTGTGAIGGSLFGRLLGLDRLRTFSGIALGSALGCFGMAALSEGISELVPEAVRQSRWFEAIGLVLLLLIVLFLGLRSRRIERERRARRTAPGEGGREVTG